MQQRRMNEKHWAPAIAALALVVAVWGCGSDGNPAGPGSDSNYEFTPPPAGSGLGLLAVSMQSMGALNDSSDVGDDDSTGVGPGGPHGKLQRTPLQDLFITFDSIRVYPACHDTASDDEEDDSGDVGDGGGGLGGGTEVGTSPSWAFGEGDSTCAPIEFLVDSLTLNVGDLDSSLALLLGTLELPEGEYSHVSLRISDAWVVTEAGETIPVELPGGSGYLKVLVRFTVADGELTEILIRFDLGRSVVEAPPGSKHFILKPVMHGMHGHGGGYMGDMEHGRGNGDGHGHGRDKRGGKK